MERVCMYLRKSREDIEAEKRGEGETLSRHRQILLKSAQSQALNIISIREEIVSGESLIHRPEMLTLLKELEQGCYDGVLCMDMDRLGRGNMQEQGLILETFKKAGAKIITPRKVYDLENEFDEEYSEFEAFMARKELKIINRRLQQGRLRSVEEGNYLGSVPPYGYQLHQLDKHRTLLIHPEQGAVVRMIFEWYTANTGASKIADKLNQLGYKTATGLCWTGNTVLNMIKNPVYMGKIVWQRKKYSKSHKAGQRKEVQQQPKKQWIIAEGQHEALISSELFDKAQEILRKKYHVPYRTKVVNPLAGLLRCKDCGASMVYRTYAKSEPHLLCYNHCGNKSSKFSYVEERLLASLGRWLAGYQAKPEAAAGDASADLLDTHRRAFKRRQEELLALQQQRNSLHDLLERGIYDPEVFSARAQLLQERMAACSASAEHIAREIALLEEQRSARVETVPAQENLLDSYVLAKDPKKKNLLLKALLYSVDYKKEKNQRNDEFSLILYPKLPNQASADKD
jgi:site-specific DNA recombinase